MIKSGLISGAAMFLLVLGSAAIFSPFCALCAPVLVGLLAGYLTGVFDKPAADALFKRAAGAGAIAGAFGVVAGMLAGVINAIVLQNPQYQFVNQAFNLPAADAGMVWAGQLGVNCCVGLLNVGLCAGLAAAGAAIWRSTAGKELPPPPPEVPAI
jgi:hypothetical protein